MAPMERHPANAIDGAGVRVHVLGDPFFAVRPTIPIPTPPPIGRGQPRARGWLHGCVYPDGRIRAVRAEELRRSEAEAQVADRVEEVRR